MAVIEERNGRDAEPAVLREGRHWDNPFINFRWQKAPSETYGRSPVMKALPDIKTLNKVVELMLKNASIWSRAFGRPTTTGCSIRRRSA